MITRLPAYSKLFSIANPFPNNINIPQKVNQKDDKILYIGRVDYKQKRVDRLLEIWAKIVIDFPSWSLDIVGDGPIKQELIEFVKVNKIERVNFISFSDPIEYYERSKILCMTSTFEGFGMVLIEASYYGCIPVAFHSFSSLSDIIENNVNGYMIKPFSLLKYEKQLRLLMGNETLRKRIQIESMNIHKKFQSKSVIKQWMRLLEELLQKNI